MRARGLELNLVSMGAVGAADIDGRNRSLRELNLLPTGGRGPHAPQITPEHSGYMLLGLASAVASDAGEAAKRYAAFVEPKGGKLIDRLTQLLSDPDRANQIDEVRLCRTHPWVMIVTSEGKREIYRPKKNSAYGPKDHMTGGREEYVIGGGLLHQIAIDLHLDQDFPGEE
jgi:hypothetical protein